MCILENTKVKPVAAREVEITVTHLDQCRNPSLMYTVHWVCSGINSVTVGAGAEQTQQRSSLL